MKTVALCGDMNLSALARDLRSRGEWTVEEAGFNIWLTATLDPSSTLRQNPPDYLIYVLSPRVLEEIEDLPARLQSVLHACGEFSGQTRVLFCSLFADPGQPQASYESLRLQRLANSLNATLLDFQADNLWFSVVDFAGLALLHGLKQISDVRFETIGRLYLNPRGSAHLADLLARALLIKTPKKVLLLDGDNTLWGGVLGEEGPDGVLCGGDGPGYAFLRFQKSLKRLKANGILLAICSKNNEADVLSLLNSHPDFALRAPDFVAHRINWEPKAENIKSLAEELSLGLDSFVFFDDSAFECEQVRQALPVVHVIQAPGEPAEYVKALGDYAGFDTFRVTGEDLARSRQYAEEGQRRDLRRKTESLDEFYASLEMKVTVTRATEANLNRVHQLVHKTNQFNLTTERLDEAQLKTLFASPDYAVWTLRLQDRLGESGLTGLVLVRRGPKVWTIDNLMLSCRIIGRTVEYALIQVLADSARAAGATELRARFVPGPRNQVAAGFLAQAGFKQTATDWVLDLQNARIPKHYTQVIKND